MLRLSAFLLAAALAAAPLASAQDGPRDDRDCDEKTLTDSVRTHLHGALAEQPADLGFFATPQQRDRWLTAMSTRLQRLLPKNAILQDPETRRDFLRTLHYEAGRAGIDPQKMLAIVHVESFFRKYAISSAGARGYMQVMPFWTNAIGGDRAHNLFALRTNLRYGAVIFRCYLDIEKGDYYRALGRYNGSLGRAKYPRAVFTREQKYWRWPPPADSANGAR